jgi:hypothetical protein
MLELGLPQRSDANQQLQEDAFHLAAWESTTPPIAELLDFHLRRLKKAQNVCTALIAYDKSGVAYCESLFIIAFFLLLPQGFKEEKEEESHMNYMSESSAFWLLYTLVGTRVNGTFKEYYGRPEPIPMPGYEGQPGGYKTSLCVTSGAMHDVALLECCLAYHEHELWLHMTKLGFQLPCVFYGAFMRLYATYMPTATVFRFWDILFSQTTDPKAQPSGRAYLIDLAFAVVRAKKADIMECESAVEIRTLIMGDMGSMYDTTTVVELALHAHKFLWGYSGFSFGKVGHLWTQREDLFKSVNETTAEQNDVLRVLTHERLLGEIPQTKYPGNAAKGVSTKELLKDVLPVMQQAFEKLKTRGQGTGQGRHWAMHRPMPLVGKVMCENTYEKARNAAVNSFFGGPLESIPCMVGPPDGKDRATRQCPGLEPLDITAGDMSIVLQQQIPNWTALGQDLWKAFTNRRDIYHQWKGTQFKEDLNVQLAGQPKIVQWMFGNQEQMKYQRQQAANKGVDERVSLNELFIALICCSRGTLGDKAAALFNIYSYVNLEPIKTGGPPYHWQPIARLAKSITKTFDGAGEHFGKNLTPPDNETLKQDTVLHLKVYSNYPSKNTFVGEVCVNSLAPFVGYNPNEAEPLSYNIWGPHASTHHTAQGVEHKHYFGPMSWSSKSSNNDPNNPDANNSNNSAYSGERVVVGEMKMALTWTPKSIKYPEEGQLCIRLNAILFYKYAVSDFYKMNPRVTVQTYRGDANNPAIQPRETKIPRWDPRGVLGTDQHHSWLTTSGAYGDHIEFEPTMKESMLGHHEHFRHWIRHGDQGYNGETGEWCWNETWGKQFSEENVKFDKKFVGISQRKNVMGMLGVRHIVSGILNRSMLNMSNRQAMLIADTLFNRQGAVPGILEAWIVTGTSPAPKHELDPELSMKKLREKWSKETKLRAPIEVTKEVMLEHERQVQRFGFMNLFHEAFRLDWQKHEKRGFGLSDMGITDPFKGVQKSLWIRYVRSGDGERCSQGCVFDMLGKLMDNPDPEIKFDLAETFPQNAVTKEEFISCMLNSPILGESLRRIGATDHEMQPRRAIPLDVTIMDPHHEEEDQQFMDAVNVGQSILVEVWDADVGSKDFLGEAWLPPLASITSSLKDYVLPLAKADFTEEAENGPSRESRHKDIGDNKITGELYVKLSWEYPVYSEDGPKAAKPDRHQKESTEFRAQVQEELHTGRLNFIVVRAHHLRRADAAKGRDCDPQVTAWVRNDVLSQWRKKPLARTGVVRNNRNPKWDNEFKDRPFMIMTGSYEARFPPRQEGWFEEVKTLFRTPKMRRHIREDREMNAIKRYGQAGLNMKFYETLPPEGSTGDKGGDNHRMEVFLGDTVREFKSKLTTACERESEYWSHKGKEDFAEKFRDIKIAYKHLVMVFVPSPKVQKLYAQKLHEGTEYKHAYNQAIQDPSSWQPLDPTRTFGQYPQHGFGRKQPGLLRIVEASEAYKLVNLRYKEFEREQSKPGYQDLNTPGQDGKCYGWAKYYHVFDTCTQPPPPGPGEKPATVQRLSNPTSYRDWEWRPAYISKGSSGSDGRAMRYKVQWIFPPVTGGGGGIADSRQRGAIDSKGRHEVSKADVLLAPRCPMVDAWVHEEHAEFLEQAKTFRGIGKSDWEIEVILNKSMFDKWEKEHPTADQASKPPRITVDIIRNFLQRRDFAETHEAEKASQSQKAKTSSEANSPGGKGNRK